MARSRHKISPDHRRRPMQPLLLLMEEQPLVFAMEEQPLVFVATTNFAG